jgi:GPH family glycoside/pentoside/hexuronide:cation symporter
MASPPPRLTRLTKILYGSGDTGFSLTTTMIGVCLAIFLTDVVGVAPKVAALAIFIGRSWDYINDPLVGHLSDRTRTRWGRTWPWASTTPRPICSSIRRRPAPTCPTSPSPRSWPGPTTNAPP